MAAKEYITTNLMISDSSEIYTRLVLTCHTIRLFRIIDMTNIIEIKFQVVTNDPDLKQFILLNILFSRIGKLKHVNNEANYLKKTNLNLKKK